MEGVHYITTHLEIHLLYLQVFLYGPGPQVLQHVQQEGHGVTFSLACEAAISSACHT